MDSFQLIFISFLFLDAFARVICGYKVRETHVVWKTRSPTWDQMLKFKDITFCGIAEEFFCKPPVVVIEIYDRDPDVRHINFCFTMSNLIYLNRQGVLIQKLSS